MPAYLSVVEPEQFKKLENLEKINFGGDYIQYKVLQDAIRIGLHFHNQYGMTEHSIYSTCKLMKVCDKTSSVGKPLKNIFFSIYDGDKNLCGQHITGICCSSGAGISRGYHDNENLNQISFLNNNDLTRLELLLNHDKRYFYSGDLAQIKSNVGQLLFHGRSDFQVKIRGMQVDIPTIEAVLGQNHLVKECIVCLRRIEGEEFLIAYIISCNDIITDEEKGQLMIKSLNEYMLGKLSAFMIPSHYVFVQQFPLNINGKINRKLLPLPEKLLNSKIPLKTDCIFEPWEKQVMGIFAALLPGKAIQIDDSFFEAGGDSLKALIAIQNIKRETGMDLQLRDIFKLASFRAILERLKVTHSIGNHKEVENLTMLESAKFRPNVLQINGRSGKLTDDQLVNNVKISDNVDNNRSLNKKMSSKYNGDKKSRFWLNGSIPVSLQQERLLFLYSFGKEYRESYKLQFLIIFYGFVDLKVLNTALNYIMRKHRLLRTIFLQKVAKVIQEVTSLSECYIEVCKNVLGYDITGSEISSELPSIYDTPLLAVTVSDNLELMLILDHLIVDGRSIAILTNDLVEFYNILINGGSVSFDFTEGTSYAEFCLQQRRELEKFRVALKGADCLTLIDRAVAKDEVEVQEKWLLKLRDFPPLSLEGDLSNEEFDRRNNVIRLKIPLYLSAIKHFCVAERCTLFAYLLGVFSLTVRSLCDQQKHRFAVVTSALNRTSDTINCVGLFVNTVIIPIDTAFDCVSELIHSLQQNITEALQFQHIPFDYIIRKLNGTRSSSGTESYQVSFVVQNASATKLPRIDGVETIVEEINAKYAKFDQAWYCTEFEDYIEVSVEYKIEKYSDLEIKYAMELFVQIASQLLSNRSMKVKGILKSCELIRVEKPLIENNNSKNVNATEGTIKKSLMLEEVLLGIWKEVLECSEISVFDNFFAIGGHSLLIPNICYKIEQQVNYQCPPQAIFKYQTVRELAQHINNKQDLKILTTSNEKLKIRVCPLQESLAKMYYNAATETSISSLPTTTTTATTITSDLIKAYQTGFSIALKCINFSKLRHSLNLILMRHFALRATFYCQNNDFFQQIHSGTEIYITPRKTNIEGASLIVPNPFHAIPILCWLIDGIKQELPDDNYCEFHFKISHIICDGKSLSIIARELSNNYFEDRHISVKDDSFIQFSKRLKQRFQERYTEMQKFWSQNLNNTEGANIHYEKITATVSSNNRCKFFYKKFKSLNILIKRVAKKCCCSPFVVQLAAFSKVLSGIATQDSKMIISCPIDMRDSRAQQCVGMCINVLPVIINFRLRNYQDLIQDIAKSFANAYINADISNDEIEKLCEKYGVSNFADIMIVNNYKQYSSHCYQILNDNSEFTKCTLTLFLTQYHEDIEAKIECKQDFFYDESMKIMLNQWAKTIRRMEKVIVTNDEIESKEKRRYPHEIFFSKEHFSVKNMDIRSKERLASSGCDNDENVLQKSDYPAFSYQHLLREAFVANRQWTAMTVLTESKESINYRTLTGLIYRTAKIIREKVAQITGGILRSDTVIPVIAHNSIKTLATCLAITMTGAAYLPIDSTGPAKRISNILEQIGAKFYVTVDQLINNDDEFQISFNFSFQNALEINLNNMRFDKEPLELPPHLQNTPNDLAYTIFTSGTTGKPKGVTIGQHGLLNMAIACTRDFWMKPGDCVYQFTNFAFDNSVLEITMALINGSALLLREDYFTPHTFLNEVKHGNITHALLFPSLVNTFKDEEIGELRHLRYWIVGAESASKRILECALKSGVNVIQNYGPTETTAYALTKRMKLLDRPNNIGRGITNVVVTVRNFCGEIVQEMGVGELCIKGVGITRGYVISSDRIRENAEKEIESKKFGEVDSCCSISPGNNFGTKDMVRMQPNNEILFLGRYDKQVKIRGYRVELGEIEAILCQYPQVKSAKVILKLIGQQRQLAAFVILSDLFENRFHPAAIRHFMQQHLPYYMIPIQYHFLQQYPLTKNSKVDVEALAMLQNPENDQCLRHAEPENSMESTLLGFFRKVLQNDNISVNDDFFAVGGNSFSATRLTELIEANVAHCIGISNVFRHRTVRRLSQHILHFHKKPSNEIYGIQKFSGINKSDFNLGNIPLSFQQQQFQFLNETKERQYYELIFVQKFDASLSLQHLKLAFLRLILRQPSFRTIFPERNFDVHQEILSGTEVYFYSSAVQNSSFPKGLVSYDENTTAKKIKILQDVEVNLKSEPPVLCAIEVTSSTSHTVILRINHIISDAWSTNLLENDLSDLYQKVLKNKQFDSNSKLPLTYAEYSIEQFEQKHFLEGLAANYADMILKWIINDPNYNNILEKWERTEGQMNHSDLVNQNLGSRITSNFVQYTKSTDFRNYSETEFTFEVKKIEKICGYFETTPLVAFLSAFASSLHELSGIGQLIINVAAANRSSKTNDIIGNFLNYLFINSANIPLEKTDIISATSRNVTTTSSKSTMELSDLSTIYASYVKKYVENIDRAVNESRQFEQVPFIPLLKLLRIKLKKLKSPSIEVLNRLHKTIFFNFRYGLEENRESVLGKGEIQAPMNCTYEIEVEIDRAKSYYSCRIRMKNRSSLKHTSALCRRMFSFLQQMSINSNIQETTKDEIIPKENFYLPSTNDHIVDLKLRKMWSECLKKRWIKDDDDFFLEGGTSLLTLKLRRLIESELKIHIELDEIFKYSTFIQLSNLLQKRFINIVHSLPDNTIGLMNPESGRNTDSAVQIDKKMSNKRGTSKETEILQTSGNLTTVRLLYQSESDINVTGSAVVVFFHALVGGVTWTYAPLIKQLMRRLPSSFKIIGVEHPNSFSRSSKDPKFHQSIESLCSKYIRDLHDYLCKVKIRLFIGASFGAILAYQCALQLQQEEIHIDDIISIDGTAQWRKSTSETELASYEEHHRQINKIVKYHCGGTKVDSELLEAMTENAWELLKMMHIYIPKRSLEVPQLHVTLLRSLTQKTSEAEEDYGWINLCSRTIIDIPFSHDTMLHDCNTDTIADIILQIIQKLDERQLFHRNITNVSVDKTLQII
ncbi:AMP-binding enzyme family protein [Brugia pahangi]